MTIADQLRSFPVPPRHVLIAAATVIERLNLNLVSMQQFTDQIKTECRELRAENERQQEAIDALKQDDIRGGAERDALRSENNQLLEGFIPAQWLEMHAADKRLNDALRQRVIELEQQRESAFRAGYTYGCAEERVNCDFAWKMCSGQV